MAIIETAGALRPGTTNTPLDQRSRVNTLAEISTLSLPYLGQIVYCVETNRYYKVTALKSTRIGALTVADAAVDTYEELPVTPAELQSLIVTQVTNNPTILTFLEELIAARIADPDTPAEELPYTYPENVATNILTLTTPDEYVYYGAEAAEDDHVWSDDDTLTVQVLKGSEVISGTATAYNGVELVTPPFTFQTAGTRCGVELNGETGTLTVQWIRQGEVVKSGTVEFTGYKVPQYFTRPVGSGTWALKINGSTVQAEYWNGSAWAAFPDAGLASDHAGRYVRAVTEPEYPALACWSNNGVDGEAFLYLT